MAEKVHRALARDLRPLASWMETERVELYLYRDRAAYQEGDFHPPQWSNGLAWTRKQGGRTRRQLAVMQDVDAATLAHELSHLFLSSFFARRPPSWLDEGLARGAESAAAGREPEPRLGVLLPLKTFLDSSPGPHERKEGVQDWYAQAESLTAFLRSRGPFRFTRLCRELNEGASEEEAFSRAYGLRSVEALEKEWRVWAGAPTSGPALRRPAAPDLLR